MKKDIKEICDLLDRVQVKNPSFVYNKYIKDTPYEKIVAGFDYDCGLFERGGYELRVRCGFWTDDYGCALTHTTSITEALKYLHNVHFDIDMYDEGYYETPITEELLQLVNKK